MGLPALQLDADGLCATGMTCLGVGRKLTPVDPGPPPATSSTEPTFIRALWGTSGSDLWAAGGLDRSMEGGPKQGTLWHFDGAAWKAHAAGSEPLTDVWGRSSDEVYAVGQRGTMLRYDGVSWSPISSPTTATLRAIHGAATGPLYAVGGDLAPAMAPGAGPAIPFVILRSSADGSSWSEVVLPPHVSVAGPLGDVWVAAADAVWAVGWAGTVLRSDGVAWQAVPSGATEHLQGLWASGPTDLWAVGDYPGFGPSTVLRSDAASWRAAPLALPSVGMRQVLGGGPGDVWVVHAAGAVLHHDGQSFSAVAYDGAPAAGMPPGMPPAPVPIAAGWASPSEAWFVDATGQRLHRWP